MPHAVQAAATMKELFFLRHAKASRDDPTLDDHDRPLAARGKRDARTMGEHMRAQGYSPEHILCSSALRTRDTLALIEPLLSKPRETHIESALYLASERTLMKRLQALDDSVSSAMLIGHNPGIEALVLHLARKNGAAAERKLRERIEEKFPTAALAVLHFSGPHWSALAAGAGRLVAVVRPRALAADRDEP